MCFCVRRCQTEHLVLCTRVKNDAVAGFLGSGGALQVGASLAGCNPQQFQLIYPHVPLALSDAQAARGLLEQLIA